MISNRIRLIKILIIWFIMGMIYFTIEGIWRIPKGGYANIIMLPIGGLCGVIVGGINQLPQFYNMKVLLQSLIGAILVTIVEFLAGCLLNLLFNLGIWDYSNMPFNLLGQICLPFTLLWFIIMPFCIWLEDRVRYLVFSEGKPYSIKSIYLEFIKFK